MKQAVAVRVNPDLLDAARVCAARERRTLTNVIDVALRGRVGERTSRAAMPCRRVAASREGSRRGE